MHGCGWGARPVRAPPRMLTACCGDRASAPRRRLSFTRLPSLSALWAVVVRTIHTLASPTRLLKSPHVACARFGADSE